MYEPFMRLPDLLAEFDRLQHQLDQAFHSTGLPASIRSVGRTTFPAVNVGTTGESVEVVTFAPGIQPSELNVTIDKGLLVIEGARKSEFADREARVNVYARERFSGPFRRVVSLPDDADPAQVNASYRDGFLHISVGKRAASRPRRIEVK